MTATSRKKWGDYSVKPREIVGVYQVFLSAVGRSISVPIQNYLSKISLKPHLE